MYDKPFPKTAQSEANVGTRRTLQTCTPWVGVKSSCKRHWMQRPQCLYAAVRHRNILRRRLHNVSSTISARTEWQAVTTWQLVNVSQRMTTDHAGPSLNWPSDCFQHACITPQEQQLYTWETCQLVQQQQQPFYGPLSGPTRVLLSNITVLIFAVLVVWCSHCRPYKVQTVLNCEVF